jgi:hypothetical protein
MNVDPRLPVTTMSASDLEREIGAMAALLHDVVHAGASVNFIMPFPVEESEAFWRKKVLPPLWDGGRLLFVARDGNRIAGTVQLVHDMPPNQPHRAEVTKLLVHPDYRRRGIGRALMQALELRARDLGRSLITLDTRTGDVAEPFYVSLGYVAAGIIPGFCRDTFCERLDPTTIMYKVL